MINYFFSTEISGDVFFEQFFPCRHGNGLGLNGDLPRPGLLGEDLVVNWSGLRQVRNFEL